MSQQNRDQGGHIGFSITTKKVHTDFVEDVEILLLVKFGSILFSACKRT